MERGADRSQTGVTLLTPSVCEPRFLRVSPKCLRMLYGSLVNSPQTAGFQRRPPRRSTTVASHLDATRRLRHRIRSRRRRSHPSRGRRVAGPSGDGARRDSPRWGYRAGPCCTQSGLRARLDTVGLPGAGGGLGAGGVGRGAGRRGDRGAAVSALLVAVGIASMAGLARERETRPARSAGHRPGGRRNHRRDRLWPRGGSGRCTATRCSTPVASASCWPSTGSRWRDSPPTSTGRYTPATRSRCCMPARPR